MRNIKDCYYRIGNLSNLSLKGFYVNEYGSSVVSIGMLSKELLFLRFSEELKIRNNLGQTYTRTPPTISSDPS